MSGTSGMSNDEGLAPARGTLRGRDNVNTVDRGKTAWLRAMLRMTGLFLLLAAQLLLPAAQAGERITVAAAADLKFALDEIVADFGRAHPDDTVEVVYGSSGKFATQIRQGAPFDLYFSADIAYPRALEAEGLA